MKTDWKIIFISGIIGCILGMCMMASSNDAVKVENIKAGRVPIVDGNSVLWVPKNMKE